MKSSPQLPGKFNCNSPPGSGGLTVSPDGRFVLFGQLGQSGSDLMLIENFVAR